MRKLAGLRQDDRLAHVAHQRVAEDDHRRAVLLAQVEGLDRERVALMHAARHEGDHRVLAVRAPAGLHDVALDWLGRQARGGPAAHDVDDHAGDLRHGGEADHLLHEAEARAAGSGERLGPGQRGAAHGGDAGDLVLHLDERAAHLGQARASISAISVEGVMG